MWDIDGYVLDPSGLDCWKLPISVHPHTAQIVTSHDLEENEKHGPNTFLHLGRLRWYVI